MKLYESLAEKHQRLEWGQRFVSPPAPILVDINNVAEYYAQRGHKRMSAKEFPKTLSPWGSAFFEHRYRGVEGVDEDGIDNLIDRVGYWVDTYDSNKDAEFVADYVSSVRPGALPCHPLEIRFIQIIYVYELHHRGGDGRRPLAEGMFTMFYDRRGELLSEKEGLMGAIMYSPRLAHDKSLMLDYMSDMFLNAGPLFLAVSLAHCKNVTLADHAPPPKVARKRIASGKPPGVTYKTLVIDGIKETLRTEGGVGKNGLKKALHICRGHFATYTPDKPLFGKVVGTVWKPMHTRGSKDRGEVKKDYKVVAHEQ